MNAPVLRMRDIVKVFPGVKALDRVRLDLQAGEIHALMGENGAGKSTLIKILTGFHAKDAGSIELENRFVDPRSPQEAEALGISTVYQEINLIPSMSVADNIVLGREPTRFGCIRPRLVRQRAERALKRLGLQLDVNRPLNSCPVAIQQLVAIARALDTEARLLVLDEPTSSLDASEVAALFTVLRGLRDKGMAILFVTHFLDQVYQLSDCITVLRNGTFVGQYKTEALPRLELIGKMLGKSVEALGESGPTPQAPADAPVPNAEKPFLCARGLGRRGMLQPIDLEIREGQLIGLAGLLGSGRTETARLLFGIDPPDQGELDIRGQTQAIRSPREAIRKGLAFCSEDRKTEGILPDLSVRENLILALQANRGPLRRIASKERDTLVEHYIRALGIKTPEPGVPIRTLSGGNQQKVLLARWLALQPQLIILDEPTRGIDVGAKAEMEKLVRSLRDQGMAVLFISSELEEVVRACDRVAVLKDRQKIGELSGDSLTENRIMNLIAAHGEN